MILSIIVIGNLAVVQSTFANSHPVDSMQNISPNKISNLDDSTASQFTNVNTFDLSSSSPSYSKAEMTDVLTASFTNIIDTQIYTGMVNTEN
jgi:hypothetical protein